MMRLATSSKRSRNCEHDVAGQVRNEGLEVGSIIGRCVEHWCAAKAPGESGRYIYFNGLIDGVAFYNSITPFRLLSALEGAALECDNAS